MHMTGVCYDMYMHSWYAYEVFYTPVLTHDGIVHSVPGYHILVYVFLHLRVMIGACPAATDWIVGHEPM